MQKEPDFTELDNISKSELVISKILTLLMEWGIKDTELRFVDLNLELSEFGSFFFPCIDWLVAEGIIRTGKVQHTLDNVASGPVRQPVLTSYGMRCLGQNISLGDTTKPMAQNIKEVSLGQRSYSQTGDFFGGLLGGFTKSLGS